MKIHSLLLFALLVAGPAVAADIEMQMTTTDGGSKVSFRDSTNSEVAAVTSAGRLEVSSNVAAGGYVSIPSMDSPGAALPGRARLFAKDVNGDTLMAYIDENGQQRLLRPSMDVILSEGERAATNIGNTFRDVHWTLDAAQLSRVQLDMEGFAEARLVFTVDHNEADTIECQAYNETDAATLVSAISDASGNPQVVVGTWTPINLSGEKVIWAQCREGAGTAGDPDIGPVRLQLR